MPAQIKSPACTRASISLAPERHLGADTKQCDIGAHWINWCVCNPPLKATAETFGPHVAYSGQTREMWEKHPHAIGPPHPVTRTQRPAKPWIVIEFSWGEKTWLSVKTLHSLIISSRWKSCAPYFLRGCHFSYWDLVGQLCVLQLERSGAVSVRAHMCLRAIKRKHERAFVRCRTSELLSIGLK